MVSPNLKQIYISLAPWLQVGHLSFMAGVQYYLIPTLREPDSFVKLTVDEESWIVSILFLLMFPMNCMAGCLTPMVGRKIIIYLSMVPHILASAILYFTYSYKYLLTSFVMLGLGAGALNIGPMMIAECCSPKIRGTMLDIKFIFGLCSFGIARGLAFFCHWRTLSLIGIFIAVVPFVISLTSPESPAWLASRGRFEECRKSFIWLRGDNEMNELDKLIEKQTKVLLMRERNIKFKSRNFMRKIRHLSDKRFWKANAIVFACVLVFDFSGKQTLFSYIDILNGITNDPANVKLYNLGFDIMDFVTLCISVVTVLKIRRRSLLFSVGIPAVIIMYILSGVCYMNTKHILPDKLSWLPFSMLTASFFLLNVGVLPILNTIQGEVYPLSHRGTGVSMNSFIYVISTFAMTKSIPAAFHKIGIHGIFLVNSIIMSISLLYLYFALPETFQKTLQDVENDLQEDDLNNIVLDASDVESFLKNRSVA